MNNRGYSGIWFVVGLGALALILVFTPSVGSRWWSSWGQDEEVRLDESIEQDLGPGTTPEMNEEVQVPPDTEFGESERDIVVDVPLEGAQVTSPVRVTGEARGSWFFEASMGVEVRDVNGVVVGEGVLEATEDWMSEELVAFEGEVEFEIDRNGPGEIVIVAANPSGMPENAKEKIIRVDLSSD